MDATPSAGEEGERGVVCLFIWLPERGVDALIDVDDLDDKLRREFCRGVEVVRCCNILLSRLYSSNSEFSAEASSSLLSRLSSLLIRLSSWPLPSSNRTWTKSPGISAHFCECSLAGGNPLSEGNDSARKGQSMSCQLNTEMEVQGHRLSILKPFIESTITSSFLTIALVNKRSINSHGR